MQAGKRIFVYAAMLFAATPASADDAWDNGVSVDARARADALYREGNALSAQQAYGPALEKYKDALALWDHPGVRLNAAVTEIQLDRILAAADDLDAALRYGDAPYRDKPEIYQEALNYQKLLAGRIGAIDVECHRAGTVVLDGKTWLACPGTKHERVLAGEHLIVGEGKGFMTISRRFVVAGGMTSHEAIELLPLESVVKLEYPSPRWMPWTATAIGAAVGLGGLALWVAGRREMDHFDNQVKVDCIAGCSPALDGNEVERSLASERDTAQLKGTIGLTMMIAGSAVTLGGVGWSILNRARRVLPAIEVAPTAGGATASARWRF